VIQFPSLRFPCPPASLRAIQGSDIMASSYKRSILITEFVARRGFSSIFLSSKHYGLTNSAPCSCSPRGVGHALALEFHSYSMRVFVTARSASSLSTLAEKGIEKYELDVTKAESITALRDDQADWRQTRYAVQQCRLKYVTFRSSLYHPSTLRLFIHRFAYIDHIILL
jgi:hypothetical protein